MEIAIVTDSTSDLLSIILNAASIAAQAFDERVCVILQPWSARL